MEQVDAIGISLYMHLLHGCAQYHTPYNIIRDCNYTNNFLSWLKTLTWAYWRLLLKKQISFIF